VYVVFQTGHIRTSTGSYFIEPAENWRDHTSPILHAVYRISTASNAQSDGVQQCGLVGKYYRCLPAYCNDIAHICLYFKSAVTLCVLKQFSFRLSSACTVSTTLQLVCFLAVGRRTEAIARLSACNLKKGRTKMCQGPFER